METHVYGHWDGHKSLDRWHVFHMRAYVLSQHLSILLRFWIAAIHAGTRGNEVQVVAVIHHRVDALRATRLDVSLIRRGRLLVCQDGGFVLAGVFFFKQKTAYEMTGGRRQGS